MNALPGYRWTSKPPRGSTLDVGNPRASGLAGAWLFNEGTGKRVWDIAGRNAGTLNGAVAWSRGSKEMALSFTGGNVTLADTPTLKPAALTLSVTLKATTKPDFASVFVNSNNAWNLGYGLILMSGNLRFFINSYVANIVETNLPAGEHKVDCTYDLHALRIYLDGALAASAPYTSAISYAATTVEIGNHPGGGVAWNGLISGVRVYSRALTAAEVALRSREPFSFVQTPAVRRFSAIPTPVLTSSDLFTVSEAAALLATITGTDTITLAEAASLAATLTSSDSATLSESVALLAAIASSDTITLGEAASLAARLSSSDAFTVSESAVVNVRHIPGGITSTISPTAGRPSQANVFRRPGWPDPSAAQVTPLS